VVCRCSTRRSSNAELFSNALSLVSELTASRPISKGEEVVVDCCTGGGVGNIDMILLRGSLSEALILNSPWSSPALSVAHLFPLGEAYGDERTRQLKMEALGRSAPLPPSPSARLLGGS
jgi:hypothetical protein